jgi:hypothetical protein
MHYGLERLWAIMNPLPSALSASGFLVSLRRGGGVASAAWRNDESHVGSCCANGRLVLFVGTSRGDTGWDHNDVSILCALQVNPAAGLGATVLPGQNVIISLFGEPGDATPFHQADWFTFDGTGFNPDAWFDGTAATRIITFTPALSRSDPVPPNGSFSSYF